MNFEQHVAETCKHLEETVLLMGAELHKELSSVAILEDVLIALINEQDEGVISGARYLIVVYLGEIVLKQTGGEWIKSEINNHIALKIHNQQSFPIEAVEDFIKDPEKEKLEFFAKGLIAVHGV